MSETENNENGGNESDSESESESRIGHAWVDFFSWGHGAMGIGIFTVTYFITSLFTDYGMSYMGFIVTFILAWLWEVFENNLMWTWGLKFENRKDSINNLLGDEMFVGLGALFMWIVEMIVLSISAPFWYFFVVAGVGLLICLVGFLIGKAYHEKHNT